MKPATRTILYTKHREGTRTVQQPVAVFPNSDAARGYAIAGMEAHKAANAARLKELGLTHLVGENDAIHPGLTFARVTVPYAPDPVSAADDPFKDESSAKP